MFHETVWSNREIYVTKKKHLGKIKDRENYLDDDFILGTKNGNEIQKYTLKATIAEKMRN